MTAVLSATDALRRDRMSSHDDSLINYSSNSSADWKEKYYEAADTLADVRAGFDDFQRSSKELEEELERELEQTEKEKKDLQVKVARAETERDDWKSKFIHLQTTHNKTTTSLQRELDQLRQEYQQLKVQMRELEMGNDDLERNERAVTSSLADVESRYSKALEEKILLEHELLDKANIEEECQRLKDEIRDANLEITVLKDQLAQAQSQAKLEARFSTAESSSTSATSSFKPTVPSSEENILATSPPAELSLSDLVTKLPVPGQISRSSSESSTNFGTARNPSSSSMDSTAGQSALLRRAGFPSAWMNASPTPSERATGMTRSHTVSSYSPSRLPTSTPRPAVTTRMASESLTASTSTANGIASRSRGVQMVSEMRARVRNLEQKLHTRVPRIRMGSTSGKRAELTAATSVANMLGMSTATPENPKASLKRRSADLEAEKKRAPSNAAKEKPGDTSGWVLIMEDSMSPTPVRDKERRRLSSPSSSPFSLSKVDKPANNQLTETNLGKSGIRRPQSRLSGDGRDSLSTISTTSSIPTPTSRPATPTFLPVPTSGMYGSGLPMMKRSTGPIATGQKRSSLGSSTVSPSISSHLQPPNSFRERPLSALAASTNKSLPPPPSTNITVRAPRPPSALGQSRIGRPASFGTGRRSTGADDDIPPVPTIRDAGRTRAGSTTATGGRVS